MPKDKRSVSVILAYIFAVVFGCIGGALIVAKQWIGALFIILAAVAAIGACLSSSKACKRRKALLRANAEKKKTLYEIREKLKRYFVQFGMEYADRSSFSAFTALVNEYSALCDERVFHRANAEKAQLESENTKGRIGEILSLYGVDRGADVRTAIDKLKSEKERRSFLEAEEKRLIARAESYKRENDLSSVALIEQKYDLSALRREFSAVNAEIVKIEGERERLEDKKAALDSLKEKISALKARYDTLALTETFLKQADRSMREKYVLPVRDRFIKYSGAILKTLGEKVVMDHDLNVFFDRSGELRSYKHLSEGQRAVLDLCLRLSLLDNLFEGEQPFVLLDDPFSSLDEVALNKALAVLKEVAKDRQIFYFCCHPSRKI